MSTHVHMHSGDLGAIADHGHIDHVHHESFLTKYFFSRDHKRIGIQFLLASLFFFVIGGLLAMAIRWHLAFPNKDFPMRWMMPNGFLDKAHAKPTEWTPGWPVKLTEDFDVEGTKIAAGTEGKVLSTTVDRTNPYRPVAQT